MNMHDRIYEQIKAICEHGDSLAEEGQYSQAMSLYEEALQLVPNPKYDWEASTWPYVALGDAAFLNRDYILLLL